jgi:hypothetical protein
MTTFSAASERNFSIMAFILSKLRNSLGPETIGKPVYIQNNIGSFTKNNSEDNDNYDNDSRANSEFELFDDDNLFLKH